jgi:Omp85 superfamily domain
MTRSSAPRAPRPSWPLLAWLCSLVVLFPRAAPAEDAPVPAQDETSRAMKFSVLPVVAPAYQPETSFLLGGGVVLVFQPPKGSARRESQVTFSGAASVRRQFTGIVLPDVYLLDDALELAGTFSAARFPDIFYGIGNETLETAEESFTPIYYEVDVTPRWRVFRNVYVGPDVRLYVAEMDAIEPDGAIATLGLTGSQGGRTVQVGFTANWDTRNNLLNPTAGGILRTTFRSALPALASDFRYDLLKLDGRRYLTLPWAAHVLALHGVMELRRGEPPFYETGRLGGDQNGRGLYEGRFRERQLISVQAEYRAKLFWRVGGVLFASAGTVAPSVDQLVGSRIHPAAGAGVRVAPLRDLPLNIRLDVAYGTDLQFYLNIGEAF